MKTLKPTDVRNVAAIDVQPGMITAEGIVLDVRPQHDFAGTVIGVVLNMACRQVVLALAPDDLVQVYARVNGHMLDVLRQDAALPLLPRRAPGRPRRTPATVTA